MKRLLVLILALLLVLPACGVTQKKATTSENIDIYYALKGNTGLDIEQRTIEYDTTEGKYTKALEEWIKGPSDTAKFEKSVSSNIKVLGISTEGDKLTVDLSKEFGSFGGSMHESAVVASLVNTMVQFPEINSVKIKTEGKELIAPSGNPYGYLPQIEFNPASQSSALQEREVTLYFADSQAMYVVPETRTISLEEDVPKDKLVRALIEEMIKGPEKKELYPTIPSEARINSVTVNGERATIDFSEEMYTKHSHGAAGEDMTLTSIANTVTEVEGIREVVLTLNGQPLNLEHAIIDSNNPLTRAEDRILKQ